MSSRHFNHNPVNGEGRAPSRPPRLPTYLHTEVVSARRAMYPRRPRRGTSERGRVATCCDRLGDRPTPTGTTPASGRSTRSARRHEDTEDFESWLTHIPITSCLIWMVKRDLIVRFTFLLTWTLIRGVCSIWEGGCPQPPGMRRVRTRALPWGMHLLSASTNLVSSVSPEGRSVCSVVKIPFQSGQSVNETARKPTSKPLSVPPCLHVLRVNRPEARSQ